jgi:iron-sulfur cluster assembly accessory protein
MNRFLLTSIVTKPSNLFKINKYFLINNKSFVGSLNRKLSTNSSEELSSKQELNKDLEIIQISDNCVQRLKKVTDYKKQFLRVEVEGGGCSGLQYKFNVSEDINSDDRVFERDGIKVVIDEESLQYLKGSTIDFNEELIKSAFRVINNPQSSQGCSCGASFTIKSVENKFKF